MDLAESARQIALFEPSFVIDFRDEVPWGSFESFFIVNESFGGRFTLARLFGVRRRVASKIVDIAEIKGTPILKEDQYATYKGDCVVRNVGCVRFGCHKFHREYIWDAFWARHLAL